MGKTEVKLLLRDWNFYWLLGLELVLQDFSKGYVYTITDSITLVPIWKAVYSENTNPLSDSPL